MYIHIYWKFKSINHNVKVEGRYEVNILLIKYVKTKLYTYFAIKRGGQNIWFTPPLFCKRRVTVPMTAPPGDAPMLSIYLCILTVEPPFNTTPHNIFHLNIKHIFRFRTLLLKLAQGTQTPGWLFSQTIDDNKDGRSLFISWKKNKLC